MIMNLSAGITSRKLGDYLKFSRATTFALYLRRQMESQTKMRLRRGSAALLAVAHKFLFQCIEMMNADSMSCIEACLIRSRIPTRIGDDGFGKDDVMRK